MPIKEAGFYSVQPDIVTGTAAADRTTKLRPEAPASIILSLTTGVPATGAKLQVTNAPHDQIDAGTALWTDYAGAGLASQVLFSAAGLGVQLTGVRAAVTDGTWALSVRQGL